jgi:UDP:flavonoid glycosyltransferase YjiC (YdhE family)
MYGQTQLVQAVCDAVACADVDSVLTLGPAVQAESLEVPTNVVTVPYGDHDQMLPGCSAVITHGGLGTTLRALAHGIPQLILPLGRDQHLNADRVAQLGAGIALSPDSSPAQIHAGLSRLLVDDRHQVAASQAAARITSDQPDQTAARALQSAYRHR